MGYVRYKGRRVGVQYAEISMGQARLCEDFSREWLTRIIGLEHAASIYSILPKYSRGPRKGMAKGYLTWEKVKIGGWVKGGYGGGRVVRPGRARRIEIRATPDTEGVPVGSQNLIEAVKTIFKVMP